LDGLSVGRLAAGERGVLHESRRIIGSGNIWLRRDSIIGIALG